MSEPFRSFVVFAGMRTGSNLLEATLNRIRRVTCFGEAFNPFMMGWPDKAELRGITMAQREADPHGLLRRLLDRPDHLPGFRYFHDHDPRVFDAIIADRTCAKIVLSRNPLDSYVSTRLAWATNQWKLNETETAVPATIRYDAAEFRQSAAETEAFHLRILRALQHAGQAAFWLGYDDLRDGDVLTGLLHWLGRTDLDRVEPAQDQVPQNPRQLSEKVANFAEMQQDLQQAGPFDLGRIPVFESRRGPAVPSFQATGAGRGLLFMPVRGGPTATVAGWLRQQGEGAGEFTQASLREWKAARPGHRTFAVLRHPLLRAWDAFAAMVGAGRPEQRRILRQIHRVALPPDEALAEMTPSDQSRHFGEFLRFLQRNLHGQTSLPTNPGWASQSEVIAGFARFGSPDAILREDRLAEDLGWLARSVGLAPPATGAIPCPVWPDFVMDGAHVAAARAAYVRDYVAFGFADRPASP